jgi:hypothetical protein
LSNGRLKGSGEVVDKMEAMERTVTMHIPRHWLKGIPMVLAP